MPLDPTAPTDDDHPFDAPPRPEAARHAGSLDPITESGEEPIRTLLWTAATYRPVEEVAALVMLLKRTGEVPNPGDEALRVAAVTRPMDEVMQLVALLNEPPHEIDEADTTLRAVAVGRPIEEVAQLVSYLGTHEDAHPFATGHRSAGRGKPSRSGRPDEPRDSRDVFARPTENGDSGSEYGDDASRDGVTEAEPAARDAERAVRDTVRESSPEPEPERVAPWTSAPVGPRSEVPRLDPAPGRRTGGGSRNRTASSPHAPLRSPLRWPAAAALLACAVIHLPTGFAAPRSGGYAAAAALAVTVLCLAAGVWVAVADSARIWVVCATASAGIIAAHTLSALGGADLLRGSLGAGVGGASLLAVGCAAVALALAGTALMIRQMALQRTLRQAMRRPERPSAPTAGIAEDA